MTISMHSASVPIFVRMLGNLVTLARQGRGARGGEEVRPVGLPRPRAWRPTCCRCRQQIQIACDAAKFCVARLAGVEAPKFDDNEKTLAELRERIAQDDRLPEVGAGGADRRQRSEARSRCRGAPARSVDRRGVPEALRAAELLLPRDHGVRAAAPQRRRARQGRLPRRAAAGRRLPPESAGTPRAGACRACERRAARARFRSGGRARRAGSRPRPGRARQRDERRSPAQVPELVQRAGEGDRGRGACRPRGAHVAERLGELEPGRGERRDAAALAEGRRISRPRRASRCAVPHAEPRRHSRGANSWAARGDDGAGAAPHGRRPEEAREGDEGRDMGRRRRRRSRPAGLPIVRTPRAVAAKPRNARSAAGQFARPRPSAARRRDALRPRRTSPSARRCTSTTARPRRRA